MSSTTMFTGDGANKPSSRVLRPPGGGSSISFGGGDADTPAPSVQKKPVQQPVVQPTAEPAKPTVVTASPAPAPHTTNAHSQPAGATGPRKTCGYNPITGEAYASEPAQKPSIHVKQPPGGASTRPW